MFITMLKIHLVVFNFTNSQIRIFKICNKSSYKKTGDNLDLSQSINVSYTSHQDCIPSFEWHNTNVEQICLCERTPQSINWDYGWQSIIEDTADFKTTINPNHSSPKPNSNTSLYYLSFRAFKCSIFHCIHLSDMSDQARTCK